MTKVAMVAISGLAVWIAVVAFGLSVAATDAAGQDAATGSMWLLEQPSIMIIGNGKALVTIKPDGAIVYGDDYDLDVAAQAFWAAVGRNKPDKDCR